MKTQKLLKSSLIMKLLKMILKLKLFHEPNLFDCCAFVMSEFSSKISFCTQCENNSWVVKSLKHTQPLGEIWWNLSDVYFSSCCKKQTVHFSRLLETLNSKIHKYKQRKKAALGHPQKVVLTNKGNLFSLEKKLNLFSLE